jgi:hypothetical protein
MVSYSYLHLSLNFTRLENDINGLALELEKVEVTNQTRYLFSIMRMEIQALFRDVIIMKNGIKTTPEEHARNPRQIFAGNVQFNDIL